MTAHLEAAMREAEAVMEQHSIGADYDGGFDGGEWSGPAHMSTMDRAITDIAAAHGLDYDTLMDALTEKWHRDADAAAEYDAEAELTEFREGRGF